MKMKASRNFRYLEKYRVFSLRNNFIQIYKMRLKNYTLLMRNILVMMVGTPNKRENVKLRIALLAICVYKL